MARFLSVLMQVVDYNASCFKLEQSSGLSSSADEAFYSGIYDTKYNQCGQENTSSCGDGSWENGVAAGWIVNNGVVGPGYFWPAIDVSSPTCGTNLSYGLLQPAVTRSSTNFLGVPTMCGTDFDNYFATVAPRNPYQQIAFTSATVSGAGSTGASLGPITVQMQDTSSGTAVALTSTSDTVVALSSSSITGVFSLSLDGDEVTSVTIPAGQSSASFYYGDTTAGTPQIVADASTMVPGAQSETITSGTSTTVTGVATGVDTDTAATSASLVQPKAAPDAARGANGRLRMRGVLGPRTNLALRGSTLVIDHIV